MIDMGIQTFTFWAVILATLAPLMVFALILIFFRSQPRLSAGLSIGAIGISLLCALFLMVRHRHMPAPIAYTGEWMSSGDLLIPVGFLLDPLNLLMLVIVTFISFLVQIYSLEYMRGDPGFSRYYAYMSLFAWAMLSLVLSPSLVQLYIFWELVGLASYLLIGFWFEKFSASQAGKKAFVMTRLGDVSFLIGILLLLAHMGNLDIGLLNGAETSSHLPDGVATTAAILIFGGIIGKSAQFPLLTWLPDAMEGPTPVSALLHSATMVAAGVFLFARLFPFFSQSQAAMDLFLFIGALSMLMAATMAMVSRDIKQVLAYSTISQLGFMIMGLAAGGFVSGVFHLTTHAGFKALLFLCAGTLIHQFHTNDIFEIGEKMGRRISVPLITLIIGGAALSGIWPFSGFYSKEMILAELAGLHNPLWLVAGLAGAFLTAYYTFRMIIIVCSGPGSAREGESNVTSTTPVMMGPLVVLAGFTIVLGFFQDSLAGFLTGTSGQAPLSVVGHSRVLMMVALGLSISGVLLAWYEFGRPETAKTGFVDRLPRLAHFFAERWYLDRLYGWFLDTVIYKGLSFICTQNDKHVIDGSVHMLARATLRTGHQLASWHKALIQNKLMAMLAVLFVLLIVFLF